MKYNYQLKIPNTVFTVVVVRLLLFLSKQANTKPYCRFALYNDNAFN